MFHTLCFCLFVFLFLQVEDCQNIETKVLTTCFFFQKRSLELFSLSHFLYDFWRKVFLLLFFIDWPRFIVWLPLLFEISYNIFIVIVCVPACDVINFEIYLSFFIKPFSYIITKKVLKKNLNNLKTKRTFKMK